MLPAEFHLIGHCTMSSHCAKRAVSLAPIPYPPLSLTVRGEKGLFLPQQTTSAFSTRARTAEVIARRFDREIMIEDEKSTATRISASSGSLNVYHFGKRRWVRGVRNTKEFEDLLVGRISSLTSFILDCFSLSFLLLSHFFFF
jgi:hypothetical protein